MCTKSHGEERSSDPASCMTVDKHPGPRWAGVLHRENEGLALI